MNDFNLLCSREDLNNLLEQLRRLRPSLRNLDIFTKNGLLFYESLDRILMHAHSTLFNIAQNRQGREYYREGEWKRVERRLCQSTGYISASHWVMTSASKYLRDEFYRDHTFGPISLPVFRHLKAEGLIGIDPW